MAKIRPAQAILNEIRNGELMVELAAAIHEATGMVADLGKPAVVTLKITVDMPKNMKNLSDPYLVITGRVATKLPETEAAQTLFKVDEDGNATRNLSRAQSDLPLSIAINEGGNN